MSRLFRAVEEALGLNYNLNYKLPPPPAGQTCAEEADGRGFLLLVFLLLGVSCLKDLCPPSVTMASLLVSGREGTGIRSNYPRVMLIVVSP